MMRSEGGNPREHGDLFSVLVVALLSIMLGYTFLFHLNPDSNFLPFGRQYLEYSVMIAAGRGLVAPEQPEPDSLNFPEIPELGRFLRCETPQLHLHDLPPGLRTTSPPSWIELHQYLFFSLGLFWRAFGVSWTTLKIFCIAMYCVMVVTTFGLFRLGMGRSWSLAGTVWMAIPFCIFITNTTLRDYSKGPFFLAILFLLGTLIRRPLRLRRFLLLAGLAGLITGIGIGFRADVFICLPVTVLVLAFFAHVEPPDSHRRSRYVGVATRLAAVGLTALCFTVAGWPVLTTYNAERLSFHDFIKGCSTVYDDTAGVGRASYERICKNDDSFVSATYENYSARLRPSHEPADINTCRQECAWKILTTFPGDMLTRAYESVLWILRGGSSTTLGTLSIAGAAVLMLAIARDNLRVAFATLLLLVYFCGYVSLQATGRHAFHLLFIRPWIAACFLESATRLIRENVIPNGAKHALRSFLAALRHDWRQPLRRMAIFTVTALLVLLLPLYAARAVQRHTLGQLLQQYMHAELVPVPVVSHTLGEWVLFERAALDPPHSGTLAVDGLSATDEYWMAEFASSDQPRPISIRYTCCQGSTTDFSQGLWIPEDETPSEGTTKYFFPVYEMTDLAKGGWSLFTGLALPKDQIRDFKGLYRVRNARCFPLFLNLALPADPRSFRDHQSLIAPRTFYPVHDETDPLWIPPDRELQVACVKGIANQQEPEAARLRFETALKQDEEDPFLRLGLACALDAQRDDEIARNAYRRALAANPRLYITYHYIDAFFKRRGDLEGRVAQWRDAAQTYPGNWLPYFHLGLALEEAQDLDGAIDAYGRVAAMSPDDTLVWSDIARLHAQQQDWDKAIDAYRHALQADPSNRRALEGLADLEAKRSQAPRV